MLEKTIEKYFVDRMLSTFPEARIAKFTSRTHDPDRICLLPEGVAVFVELKRPGEKLRAGQERAAERLRKLGFSCYSASTKGEVDSVIYKILTKER